MATVPNTPAFVYLDTAAVKKNCSREKERIDKACAPRDPKKPSFAEKLLGKKGAAKLEKLKKELDPGAAQWVRDHCDGLWFKPVSAKQSPSISEIADELKNLTPQGVMQEVQKHVDEMVGLLEQAISGAAKEAAEKAALKRAAAWGAGLLGGPWGEFIATAYNTVDSVISAVQLKGMLGVMKDELGAIKDIIKSLPGKLEQIVKDAESNPQKAVADLMSLLSRLDGCLRARRCQLVPMGETHYGPQEKCEDYEPPDEVIPKGPNTGKGCCPGQTGHHVVPGSMFKNCPAYLKMDPGGGCPHQNAPTICVEGVNNSHGSHGLMHGALEVLMKKYPGGSISLDKAIEEGVDSVRMVFPESACSAKCLKAQLKAFYQKYETCSPLVASSGKGGDRNGGTDK
jgi:uncharacterized protein YjgD (DUF1641 family)